MEKEKTKRLRSQKCEVSGFIPYVTEEKILNGIKELSDRISKWCYRVHDKDVNDDGTPKDVHFHCYLQFTEQIDFSVICKAFDCEMINIRFIDCKFYNGAIPYLVHHKKPHKYQYDIEGVKANFDYAAFMKKLINKENGINRLTEIRTMIEEGTIREYNYMEYITMEEYGRYKSQIDRFFKYRRDIISKLNMRKKCIFITGEQGSGKTTFAVDWANEHNYSCFVSGSSNDPFDNYKGEDVVVLDDLRGSCFTFSDLLKILDNDTSTLVKSRYSNKVLECKYIIITSVVPIDEFYNSVFENNEEPITQFKRRCGTYIEMTREVVKIYHYNKDICDYELKGAKVNNNPNLYADSDDDDTYMDMLGMFPEDSKAVTFEEYMSILGFEEHELAYCPISF